MIVAGTGHRPDKLGGHEWPVMDRLISLARDRMREHRPDRVISGMALGWDQSVAHAALEEQIYLICAVPFKGCEKFWPTKSQDAFNLLLDQADEVHFICDQQGPFKKAFQLRNEWMVDRADKMLALWDGSWGGTFNCLQYAQKKGVQVENLWSRWEMREMLL